MTESHLLRYVRTHRSTLLACILVAEMLVSPAADYHPHFGAVLAAFIWIVLLLAAFYLASARMVRWVIVPIAVVWVAARLLEAFGNPAYRETRVAPIAGLVLSCAVLWALIERGHRVLRTPRTAVAEAFIAYLIIAIAFAQLYWILNQTVSNAFNHDILPHQISTLLYFSLVTISSVGYGGIVPINPYVRMVAAFEGITGIFFIAVVVARLVAVYQGPSSRNNE